MSNDRICRLNSAIAKAGFCSRREADELIKAGRVSVNGHKTSNFGLKINLDSDQLKIDGKPVQLKKFTYIALHKPKGIIVTCAYQSNKKNVLELLPQNLRHLRPVGRLDVDSEGLLLLTNDGNLAYTITHPSNHCSKKYIVTVHGQISAKDIKLMAKGIEIEGKTTMPAFTRLLNFDGKYSTIELIIKEGRNRQIRKMCTQLGYLVHRLVRVAIGELKLGQMTPGSWRYLNQDDLRQIITNHA